MQLTRSPAVLGALLCAALGGGCTETGMLLEVDGPVAGTSLTLGVDSLEFVVANRSFCDRWVADTSASYTVVKVSKRDLEKTPYQFRLRPSHFTDLSDPVYVVALARDASGQLLGSAIFDPHPFMLHQLLLYRSHIHALGRGRQPGGPQYVSTDSHPCLCIPGQRWVGSGEGTPCDLDVVTSFDRLADTAGCELAKDRKELLGPVCDGQNYNETADRDMPCFVSHLPGPGAPPACLVNTRSCHDADGVAYSSECAPPPGSPLEANQAFCDAYLHCEQEACVDLVDCWKQAVPVTTNLHCTVHVADGNDMTPPAPCAIDGKWEAALDPTVTGPACVGTVLQGTTEGPLTVGWKSSTVMGAQALSADCPPTLVIDQIDWPGSLTLPPPQDVDVTLGKDRAVAHFVFVHGCPSTVAGSLECVKQ